MDLLEEIRLLSNLEHKGEKLLQIFLVGQPELEAHLARHELRQLRQRIAVRYTLHLPDHDELQAVVTSVQASLARPRAAAAQAAAPARAAVSMPATRST